MFRTATTLHFATQNICKWLKKSPDSTIISVREIEEKKKSIYAIMRNELKAALRQNIIKKRNTGKRPQGIQDSLIFPH